jgi:hypothetical protein
VVRLLVIVDRSEGELDLSTVDGHVPHAPLTFSLGDDDPAQRRALAAVLDVDQLHAAAYHREQSITAPAIVEAPPARRRASSIHDAAFERAFAALDGVRLDLLEFAIDTIADELDLEWVRRRDLLHAIVTTGRTMHDESVRVEQPRVVGADYRWLDVVQSAAFPEFMQTLTRHYDASLQKRRFKAA